MEIVQEVSGRKDLINQDLVHMDSVDRGKRYLSYIQTKPSGDEFLIRDNLIKPLFTDVLGYDKPKGL